MVAVFFSYFSPSLSDTTAIAMMLENKKKIQGSTNRKIKIKRSETSNQKERQGEIERNKTRVIIITFTFTSK